MLSLQNVSFAYPRRPQVLDALTFDLPAGSICGLLGLNGVGKTTLMHLISGLLLTRRGVTRVMGHNPNDRSVDLLADLYYLPADLHLPKLSIAAYARRYGPFYPGFSEATWEQSLQAMTLTPDMRLDRISFGQRKKAMLCFALATQCRLLLLDEPTDGLDTLSKGQFRQLLSSYLAEDRLIVAATHHVGDLATLVDHLLVLKDQSLLLSQSVETIIRRFSVRTATTLPTEGVLYSERALSGWQYLTHNTTGAPGHVDLEFFFNAVSTHPAIVQHF